MPPSPVPGAAVLGLAFLLSLHVRASAMHLPCANQCSCAGALLSQPPVATTCHTSCHRPLQLHALAMHPAPNLDPSAGTWRFIERLRQGQCLEDTGLHSLPAGVSELTPR